MHTRSRVALAVMAAWLAVVAPAAAAVNDPAPRPPRPAAGIPPRAPGAALDEIDARQQGALQELRKQSPFPLIARFADGQPRFLQGRIPATGETAAAMARDFLDRFGKDLWRLGPNSELRLLRSDPDTGLASFAQRYRGLPVMGGQVNVFARDGVVHAAMGGALPGDGLDVTPTIGEAEARTRAVASGGTVLAPPRLAVSLLRRRAQRAQGPRLVWAVPVATAAGRVQRLLDAHTGEVAHELRMEVESAASEAPYSASVYDVNGSVTVDGCEVEGDDLILFGDGDSIDPPYASDPYAYGWWYHTRRAYSFFYDRFGRQSYDGANGPVTGIINSLAADNAEWSWGCLEMRAIAGYGSPDVPVHELAHGVTQFTSGMVYEDESGALNESFSDVMAALADPENDWLQGEDHFDGDGDPSRSLRHPPDYGDPDRFMNYVETFDDNGGVHTNSGIPNKAAFLLSEGGTHNGRVVTGLGRVKAGKVLYPAYTGMPTYGAFMIGLRDSAVALAELFASAHLHGFTAADVCSTRNAYAAVDLGAGDADCDGVEDGQETDPDGDGIPDTADNCDFIANPAQSDLNNDGWGDACDSDDDGDHVADLEDNCPTRDNDDQADLDDNGIGDVCEDPDGDGLPNSLDNCPDDYNPGQEDSNSDGFYGDVCDPDPDGDGVPASQPDNCPVVANTDQTDSDGDFYGDACDGCPDLADTTPAYGFNGQPFEPDTDGDGTPDACDTSVNMDGRGMGDGLTVSREPRPGTVSFDTALRVPVPLALCPAPCAEVDSSPLAGTQLDLDLAGLAPGITAMVTDEGGQAWARSATLSDGTRRLRFLPQAGRQYFLTFVAGAGAPSSSSFEVRRLLASVALPSPADLAVTVTDDPDPVLEDGLITYTVRINNEGLAPAAAAVLTAAVPAQTTLVSAEGCTTSGTAIECALGPLSGGQGATRTVVVRTAAGFAGTTSFTASVTSATTDPVPTNNSATEQTTARRREADLRVALTDSPDPVRRGELLTWRLTVTNHGPEPAQRLVISDLLPEDVALVSAGSDRGACRADGRLVLCTATSLAAHQTAVVTVVARVSSQAKKGSTLWNLAGAAAETPDPDYGNNAARQGTLVGP